MITVLLISMLNLTRSDTCNLNVVNCQQTVDSSYVSFRPPQSANSLQKTYLINLTNTFNSFWSSYGCYIGKTLNSENSILVYKFERSNQIIKAFYVDFKFNIVHFLVFKNGICKDCISAKSFRQFETQFRELFDLDRNIEVPSEVFRDGGYSTFYVQIINNGKLRGHYICMEGLPKELMTQGTYEPMPDTVWGTIKELFGKF